MTFVSVEFLILLAVTRAAYAFLPARGRTWLLLTASYVFYAYWNPWYAVLIAFSTLIDYGAAHGIARSDNPHRRRALLWTSIAANLGLLGYFKYTNFGLHILHGLFGDLALPLPTALDILLPVGISFYTFQSMSYTIDVYRGRIAPEPDLPNFALYVAFFPQLVAGPIERAGDLLPQLRTPRRRDDALFESGVRLLLWGFAKKLIVANRLLAVAQPMMTHPGDVSSPDLLFATLALFTMLYFDFSAYTDMARGTAALFGVRLTENFHLPMAATSIAAFWRGWHMTLSSWVRDYVYIPLGGGQPRGVIHQATISLLTMGLVGLWHGANWTYVVWGLQHGVFMVLYQLYFLHIRRPRRRAAWINSRWFAALGWTATMLLHALSMVWFFSPDLDHALACLGRFFSLEGCLAASTGATGRGFLVLFGLWIVHVILGRFYPLDTAQRWPPVMRGMLYAGLFFLIAALGVPHGTPFVYFQF